MNVLTPAKRLQVLAGLVDGNSESAVSRLTDVNPRTVSRLNVLFGQGALRLHDRLMRSLTCALVAMDEIWAYVGCKAARVTPKHPSDYGEAYVFSALDVLSRAVIAFLVGPRNEETTRAFVGDLRSRLVVMPQITTDGFVPYISAIDAEFGPAVPYAQTVKNYSRSPRRQPDGQREDHRYEPPRDPFMTKHVVFGVPNMEDATTSYVERNNGTMRHKIGRMRRLTYAFSKRRPNLECSVALNYAHYNFCWIVKTLRVTPAMALGVTDHVWDLEEFMTVLLDETPVEKPKPQPLTIPKPDALARELPNGRGFLRLVRGGAT